MSDLTQISREELINLSALDSDFYCRTFFPSTFRLETPPFHRDIWQLLEYHGNRHVAIEVFRGGAKTTTLRVFTSKRIAYGISRTVAYVSKAQDHAIKSLMWLKKQVEFNRVWAGTFGLSQGKKWSDEWIEIYNKHLDFHISIVALGITGQTRGLNIDDYRPDLIIVDDPSDEENTNSPEQRKKISDLFFGSLEKSLAPRMESQDAKIVLLQTSLDTEDLINACHKDKQWATRKYGCFDSTGRSRWEAAFPTKELQESKLAHIDRNQLLLWLREMECVTVGGEAAYFRSDWLQYYDIPPDGLVTYIGVDPVPPPSERASIKGLLDNDFECIFVLGVSKGRFYLLEYAFSRGHTPDWTITKFFSLVEKWRPLKAQVETVAYQKVLKWLFEQEMRKRGRYVQISEGAKRPKQIRLKQAYSGIASAKSLFVRRSHVEFIEQFSAYPFCAHDDILDAGAMAIECAQGSGIELGLAQEHEYMNEAEPLDMSWRLAIP